MKYLEIKEKKETELVKTLKEKRVLLREVRFDTSGSHSKDSFYKRKIKKDIARILTEIRKRANGDSK